MCRRLERFAYVLARGTWRPQSWTSTGSRGSGPRSPSSCGGFQTSDELEDLVKSIVAVRESAAKDAVDISGLRSFLAEYLTPQERASLFGEVLPAIQRAASEIPSLPRFPVLADDGQLLSFTNRECAVLVAAAFLCAAPAPRPDDPRRFNEFSFALLHGRTSYEEAGPRCSPQAAAKLRCFLNYLRRALLLGPPAPAGAGADSATRRVVLQRRRLASEPRWDRSAAPLAGARPTFHLLGTIEDAPPGTLQVDFANELIGGGALSTGCVQEEIRFALSPECLVSMLVCPVMKDDEAILISGTERYSDYRGYAFGLEFAGDHVDSTPMDERGNLRSHIVAIDAVDWRWGVAKRQYRPECMRRELRKALAGFLPWPHVPETDAAAPIASGHWGCGAFLGDRQLKFLLQAMAAAEAGRPLLYYAFGDSDFVAEAERVWGLACARLRTVGGLWGALLGYSALRDGPARAGAGAGGGGEPPTLFSYLAETLADPASRSYN
eukprot:tig00020675_g12585.t1